jgi:hypothetical protein
MFDLSITQLLAISIAIAALVYMFKDTIIATFKNFKNVDISTTPKADDSQSIKELLDFRGRYTKGSLVYSKLTEVIEALLNKDE